MIVEAEYKKTDISHLGIDEQDMPQVLEICKQLSNSNKHDIITFGSKAAKRAASSADDLLAHSSMADIDIANKQFVEVTKLANSINLSSLTTNPLMLPVIGDIMRFSIIRWITQLYGTSVQKVNVQFDSAKNQMDALMNDLGRTQTRLTRRNSQYETLYNSVNEEYRNIGYHIAAGKLHLKGLQVRREDLSVHAHGGLDLNSHKLQELNQCITDWEKRIANLTVSQQSAFQALPTIRIVQQNNLALVEKFESISTLTVPLWKRQFMLHLGINEQKNAVELADMIDETTNRMLMESADMLKSNSIQTAKSNKRLAIDVKTLQHVQNRLLETIDETAAINAKAESGYQSATIAITEMRDTFKSKLLEHAENQNKTHSTPLSCDI